MMTRILRWWVDVYYYIRWRLNCLMMFITIFGGQGCYCLMRGPTGSLPYTVHELP